MIFRCDKCKKIIKKRQEKFAVRFEDGSLMNLYSADLCKKCAKPLKEYLHKFFNIKEGKL